MIRKILLACLLVLLSATATIANSVIPGTLTVTYEVVKKDITVEGYYYGDGSRISGITLSNEGLFVKKAGDHMTGNLTTSKSLIASEEVSADRMFISSEGVATGAHYLDAFELQLAPPSRSNLTAKATISNANALGTDVGFLARIIGTGVTLGNGNSDEIVFDDPYENLQSYLGNKHSVLSLLFEVNRGF